MHANTYQNVPAKFETHLTSFKSLLKNWSPRVPVCATASDPTNLKPIIFCRASSITLGTRVPTVPDEPFPRNSTRTAICGGEGGGEGGEEHGENH